MKTATGNNFQIWKLSTMAWAMIILAVLLLAYIFFDGIGLMMERWNNSPEYGYGYMIPVVTGFLAWQKKDVLEKLPFQGAWLGLGITVFGILLFLVGRFSTLYVLVQYSFLMVLIGAVLSFTGRTAFKLLFVPLLILFFMIPLPNFLYTELSSQLQLLSSQIGVWLIRLFGISVFLEGNVIDLGTFKLQVVEACNGLRYLLPLMVLGFMASYFFKVALWKRWVVFLSTIPITVLMNSFRIGIIGVTVEHWGPAMAEGFLHDFEGWIIFMTCLAILFLEMWVLAKIGKDVRPWREVFGLELPAPGPKDAVVRHRDVPKPFIATVLMLVLAAGVATALPSREEVLPARKDFSVFPLVLGDWQGRGDRMEQIYVNALNFDDYLLADYKDKQQNMANLYVGYYATQRADKLPHSPRACLPGGGWVVQDFTQREIAGVKAAGHPLKVNRTVIQMGENRQLVYYWFQQRGRVITSEYLVKWYLFVDALLENRSDGALVRLVAPVKPDQKIEDVDAMLASFAKAVTVELDHFIPE